MSRVRTMLLLSVSLLLVLGILWGQGVFSTLESASGSTACTGPLTGTFTNVVVPESASCTLSSVLVQGNVQVQQNARLVVNGVSTIQGNVAADHCVSVMLSGTVVVGGNVEIQHCTQPSGYTGPGIEIGGNVECHNNAGACVAESGTVSGNMHIHTNTSATASDISLNRIGGTLHCQGNTPPPTHALGPNAVTGHAQDQCDASLGFVTPNDAPVANAGPNQTVVAGTTVHLDGSGSYDVGGAALTFHWTFTATPTGSLATLSDPTAVQPAFAADRVGTYTVRLIVNDGVIDSAPATVTISTTNSPPVAHAGPNQTVVAGTTVHLDGSNSSDVDGDPLTFRWALTTAPAGSLAALSDPAAVQPTFEADRVGSYVVQLIVNDGTFDSTPTTVTISTTNSPPVAHAGPPQTVVVGATVTLDGSASSDVDGDPLTFRWALTVVPTGSTTTLTNATTVHPTFVVDQAGIYVAQLIVNDGTLDSAPVTVTITAKAPPPPPISPGQITLSGITNGQVTVAGAPGAGTAGTTVTLTNTRTGQKVTGIVQANGSFTLQIAAQGGDTLSLIVTDATGQSSPATTVTVGSGLPPDPATVAPPLDRSVATTMVTATAFLYTGPSPIQTGVAPGTIAPQRVAVLRGQVRDQTGAALPGVQISILQHPEFGQTLSRADGMFDLAVNGGGLLTVSYQKDGMLPAQRQVHVPWQDYAWLPEVVLLPYDTRVTQVDLTAPGFQVAQGRVSTDARGTRQATVLFAPGTQATLHLPDGSTQALSTLHVRVTEQSVGDTGPQAVTAEEPATVAYTYGVDLTAEEALAAHALALTFSQPVILYVQNFIGFPVGGGVPVGGYESGRGLWVPQPNGRVVQVLSVVGGQATLDVTGSGQPASPADRATLGITDAELQQVALLYASGQTLWRVLLPHFSYYDT